jgi:hypothetical protein
MVSFDSEDSNSKAPESETPIWRHQRLETNHEQTLYVPYVFRNHLISRQQAELLSEPAAQGQIGSRRMSQADPETAAGANGARITSARAAARFPSSELS